MIKLQENKNKPPSVCVVIPTYLREETLLNTVACLLKQDRPADEILVIDQTPEYSENVEKQLQEWHQNRVIRRIKQNVPSVTQARNRGAFESHCDILIFIDDDVLLNPSFINKHIVPFSDMKLAGICGQVYELPIGMYSSEILYARLQDYETDEFRVFRFENGAEVPTWRGCNCSVRREVFISVGGSDEAFIGPSWGEEDDVAFRIRSSGGKIKFYSDVSLIHLKAPIGGCRLRKKSNFQEWKITTSSLIMLFRHKTLGAQQDNLPNPNFVAQFFKILRQGPLRRQNIVNPFRMPYALFCFLIAICYSLFSLVRGPYTKLKWK